MHFLFLGIGDLGIIDKAFRLFLMLLCKGIYKLIANVFQLFTTVSRLNILSSDGIAPIYQRVTMILTIVMIFYVTFEFVKYVIEPDTFSDKEKGAGKLVYRMILVVVLIAFVPKIFSIGYQFQNKVIENQVLSKIILGKKSMDFKSYGYDFSANVLGLFYSVDQEVCGSKCSEAESLVNTNLERLRKSGDTKYLDDSLNEANKVTIDGQTRQRPIIDFDGFFAVIVGGVIVYILILYSIDVGTRYAQLIFLQIMSPVAIISYISPKKDGMFSKWTKQCITTYIDLFIRLAIIYFVLLIIQVLGTAYDNGSLFQGLGELSGFMKMLCYIVLVMGLLVFANKAPKMLSDLLGNSGAAGIGFGFRSPGQVIKDAPLLGRTLGTAYAGTGSMLKNMRKSGGKAFEALKKGDWGEARKWLWRGTAGSVGAALGGAVQGIQTTDIAGWQRAMKKSYDRRQANYKIKDIGYSMGGDYHDKWMKDKLRQILLMDQEIEDIAEGQDAYVQAIQQNITVKREELSKNHPDFYKYSIQKSKATGKFLLYEGGKLKCEYDPGTVPNPRLVPNLDPSLRAGLEEIAKYNEQLGKAQGQNKALHQKENEAKEKK